MSENLMLLTAFVAFVAVWFGVCYTPDEVFSEDTRSNILMLLCFVFGTSVNILVIRWLRNKKEHSEERLKQEEKAQKMAAYQEKKEKEEAKNARLLAKAKKKEADELAKNPPPPPTDGSDKPDDLYRPKRKPVEKPKIQTLDDWDTLDVEMEFIKVNGDPRATGELSKQEKNQLEMMKAYQQDPEGMKAAMKQAKAMQSMKKQQRAQQGDIVTKSAEELQSEARAEQKANLQKTLEKFNMQGSVFSGDDLKTEQGMSGLADAMSKQKA